MYFEFLFLYNLINHVFKRPRINSLWNVGGPHDICSNTSFLLLNTHIDALWLLPRHNSIKNMVKTDVTKVYYTYILNQTGPRKQTAPFKSLHNVKESRNRL